MALIDLLVYAILLTVAAIFLVFVVTGTFYNNYCASQYDYQSGETFLGNFSSLSYNVLVSNQTNDFGKGQGYLLNGVTNKGYWYQVGIAYNWSTHGTEHNSGFSMLSYLEFITEINVTSLGADARRGDAVLLEMNIQNDTVHLKVHDWNTNVSKTVMLPAFNATYFVGGPYINGINNGTADKSGHFTGLMTEEWSPTLFSRPTTPIVYSPFALTNNAVRLFVHNEGPFAQQVGSQTASAACAFDLFNYGKQQLNQSTASHTIEINDSVTYIFSPYPNVTLEIYNSSFVTK